MEDFGLDLSLTKQVGEAILDEKDPLAILKEKLSVGDRKSLLDYKDKRTVDKLRAYQRTLFKGDKHMGNTAIIHLEEVRH